MKLGDFFDSSEFGTDLTDQDLQNYFLLCEFVLNPVRNEFGVVNITSGKRTKEEQERLKKQGYKPSETSQHLLGEACDFVCPYSYSRGGMGAVYSYIVQVLKHSGQLFWYRKKGHVHVGLSRYNIKGTQQVLDE